MAAPPGSLLRLLALQPELLLEQLVSEPLALIRLARTCRAAYKICFSATHVWREVCVRHHVFLPAASLGPRFVAHDTARSASQLRELYKQDLLFARGEFASQFSFPSPCPRSIHVPSHLHLTENWYVLIRQAETNETASANETTLLIVPLRGGAQPLRVSFGNRVCIGFPMPGDKLLVEHFSDSEKTSSIRVMDVAAVFRNGSVDHTSCPFVATLPDIMPGVYPPGAALLDATIVQYHATDLISRQGIAKFITIDPSSLAVSEIAALPINEEQHMAAALYTTAFVHGSGRNGSDVLFTVWYGTNSRDGVIVNAKGQQLIKFQAPHPLWDHTFVLGTDSKVQGDFAQQVAGEPQPVFLCTLHPDGKLDYTSIGAREYGIVLQTYSMGSCKYLSWAGIEWTLHDMNVSPPALCYRISIPGGLARVSNKIIIRGRIALLALPWTFMCLDWLAGKLEGAVSACGKLSPNGDVLCDYRDNKTTLYRFW